MNRYVIDRAALEDNVRQVMEKAGVPVIGVVKANGYGFGMQELAQVLKSCGVRMFAITEVEDIDPLRAVLDAEDDVLVMRSTALAREARAIVESGSVATVGSHAAAHALSEAARAVGRIARCHLKVDTGFGRYGFRPDEVDEALSCYQLEGLRFEGIYTHFSTAYGDAELTLKQLEALKGVAARVESAGFKAGMIHAANSPALYNVEGCALDAVRIGSAFTGRVITFEPTGLHRLGYLEAEVIDVKQYPAGASLGYGGASSLRRAMEVAFVSAGTQEGFGLEVAKEPSLRHTLSVVKHTRDKSYLSVYVGEQACPVVGEVDLSMCMVDVTGKGVKAGDRVRIDLNPLMVSPKVERVFVRLS